MARAPSAGRRLTGTQLAYAGREAAMESAGRMGARMMPPASGGVRLIAVPSNAGCRHGLALRLGPRHVLALLKAPSEAVTHIPPALADTADVGRIARQVAHRVAREVTEHRLPIVLGGDHTVALGGVMGVRRGLDRKS